MGRINTNIPSLQAIHRLTRNNNELATRLQQRSPKKELYQLKSSQDTGAGLIPGYGPGAGSPNAPPKFTAPGGVAPAGPNDAYMIDRVRGAAYQKLGDNGAAAQALESAFNTGKVPGSEAGRSWGCPIRVKRRPNSAMTGSGRRLLT